MTTATIDDRKLEDKKTNDKRFISRLITQTSDSVSDTIITVLVTALVLAYISVAVHPALQSAAGFYVLGMIAQLMIRIVHRFDDHYTTDELAERQIEMENRICEKLDRIERNV